MNPIPVKDLAAIAAVYGPEGREPELTAKLPKPRKGQPEVPDIGDTVTLASPTNGYAKPASTCEGEVVAVAVIVRPRWDTLRRPWQEEQDRLRAVQEGVA